MVRISKRKLSEDILSKIYKLFFEAVKKAENEDHFIEILDDFISSYEKIAIAKRIGIIYLLNKEIGISEIASTLKVSKSTVSKYASMFDHRNSRFVDLLNNLLLKEKITGFLDDVFSDLFIQPGLKIGHQQLEWQHKIRKERRKTI